MSSQDADAEYWAGLRDGVVKLPRCGGCGVWQWPAVSRCGECGSWDSEWHEVAAEGTIYTWARTHHPFAGTEQVERPYVSVLVELADAGGIRLLGTLDADAAPQIGDAVTARVSSFPYAGRDIPSLVWHLAPTSTQREG